MDVLAVDIGASSGRVMLGRFSKGRIKLETLHRFPNKIIEINNHLHWDILSLFEEIKTGLKIAKKRNIKPESIGIDTWGVDYALLTNGGVLQGLPYAYRDSRTKKAFEDTLKKISKESLYAHTGIQLLQINTIFQLAAFRKQCPALMNSADKLLMIPDLLNYFLTGRKITEYTIASTTGLLDIKKKNWSPGLIKKTGLKRKLFTDIIRPGSNVGKISKKISSETGIECNVTAVASHDTASAVAAVPMDKKENSCYISSGTWSLIGVELQKPVTTKTAMKYNFSNEGGFNGTFRFLKNVNGLWIIQECQRIWKSRGKNLNFVEICAYAEKSKPLESLIDPDDPVFLAPDDMIKEIQAYCKKSGQKVPESIGAVARCVFESLAFKYKIVLDSLNEITKTKIETIHIVGGGSNNELLCQLTANATGCKVLAGPVEATALGNIGVQLIASGAIASLDELRKVVSKSFQIKKYYPNYKIEN
ncbi:MAG: rhamnulokinase [Elusimicrobia bacterium RIFOXYA2_FULL_39_19]|nr:MAG: rhamnulokinase [Elusimicrobia bacterium RIFOXYA2_FULL_39_19]